MEIVGWSKEEYGGSNKRYMNGMVTGSVLWAISGDKGYVARIGNLTLKKRFKYMDDAKKAIDNLVLNRCLDYVSKRGYNI